MSIRCFFGHHKFAIKPNLYLEVDIKHQLICERCKRTFLITKIQAYKYNPSKRWSTGDKYDLVEYLYKDEHGRFVIYLDEASHWLMIEGGEHKNEIAMLVIDQKKKKVQYHLSNDDKSFVKILKVIAQMKKAMVKYNTEASVKLLSDKIETPTSRGELTTYDESET